MSSTTYDQLRVAGIVDDSITDGPGLRLTIFLQGCRRNCPGCHNPDAQDVNGGALYSVEQLWERIQRNPLLSGVTYSGGEPLYQARALTPLAKKIKQAGLTLMVYTGYTWEELTEEENPDVRGLLAYTDILVDGPFLQAQRDLTLRFRGSANQRALDVQKSLAAGGAVRSDIE